MKISYYYVNDVSFYHLQQKVDRLKLDKAIKIESRPLPKGAGMIDEPDIIFSKKKGRSIERIILVLNKELKGLTHVGRRVSKWQTIKKKLLTF